MPEKVKAPPGEKKWLLWGLLGFTGILLITAVVLFIQLRKPVEAPRLPKPSASPEAVEVKQAEPEDVCALSMAIEELVCERVVMTPSGTTVGASDTRDLEAEVTGGSGTYSHSWTISTDGSDGGSLSSDISNPTTWTAPGSLDDPQSWTITDTITDTSTIPQVAECEVTLNFSGLIACFDECESDLDCEEDLRCMEVSGDYRCVNSSCPEESDCVCGSPSPSASPSPSPSGSATPSPSASTPITYASPSPSASTVARVEQPELPEAGVATPAVLGVSVGLLLVILGLLF